MNSTEGMKLVVKCIFALQDLVPVEKCRLIFEVGNLG